MDNGGPAFPGARYHQDASGSLCGHITEGGMSLRDYFAWQALTRAPMASGSLTTLQENARAWALVCYALADAMLDVRKR